MKSNKLHRMRMRSLIVLAAILIIPAMSVEAASNSKADKSHQKSKGTTRAMTVKEIKRYNARRFDVHNIYVDVAGGYSGLMHGALNRTNGLNYTGQTTSQFLGGGGGYLGLGYEYNYKRLIISVGPEFRLLTSADRLSFDSPYTQAMSEYNQTKYYKFDALQENATVGQLMVPVLAGMQLNKWYWKAGVKVGYTLMGNYAHTGQLTTSILDPKAYEQWYNIPNHDLQTASYSAKGTNTFGLDLTASAEIGIRLDKLLSADWIDNNEASKYPQRMRVALFADYGFWNMHINNASKAFATTSENDIQVCSYHASEWGAEKLNSLLVGVKFTYELQLTKVKEAKKYNASLCIMTYDEVSKRRLSGVAVQYRNETTGKVVKKTSNDKGIVSRREMETDVTINAQKTNYIPVHDLVFHHGTDKDTARVPMRHVPVLVVSVLDSKTAQPVSGASLQFIDQATGEQVAQGKTSVEGDYQIKLPYDGQSFKVHIEAPDYLSVTEAITTIDGVVAYNLEKIVPKRKIVLHNLYFATNSVIILPESEEGLNDLYELLNENPELQIRIIGHTDNVGSDKANEILSEGRANSVRDDMIRRGIDANRIETEGKGESEPVDTNDTEEGRARNRRVEFIIK